MAAGKSPRSTSRRFFIKFLGGAGICIVAGIGLAKYVILPLVTPRKLSTTFQVSQTAPDGASITKYNTGEPTSSAIVQTPWKQLSYQLSWHAGDKDVAGNSMYGTEIMRILPHKGKLYASTSMWMESDPSVPMACQLLVLDSPDGKWKILHQFTTKNLRLVSLQNVTFATDGVGKEIQPVEMLLTAPDTVGRGDAQVFSLDDNSGKLVPMSLGVNTATYAQTRAIGSHHDAATGIDMVFACNDILGMISGGYDPSVSGRIKWQSTPELAIPRGERGMAFTNCGGVLYCATTNHIYKRTDGATPSWESVYYDPREINAVGIRGLTAVPNPSGKGEVILFRSSNAVRHIDPADNYKETIALNLNSYFSDFLKTPIPFVLGAYNDFLPYTVPGTGETVYLFGVFIKYSSYEVRNHPEWRVFRTPTEIYAAEGRYLIRHTSEKSVSFEMAEVTDPALPILASVRTIAVSPFPADNGRALYFGGFDCASQPSHNTAWIYRGIT